MSSFPSEKTTRSPPTVLDNSLPTRRQKTNSLQALGCHPPNDDNMQLDTRKYLEQDVCSKLPSTENKKGQK